MKLRGPRGRRIWKLGDELRHTQERTAALLTVDGPRTAMEMYRKFLPVYVPPKAPEER